MKWNWRFRKPLADTRLSLEGWVFLVILSFITIGAILRNVNLLVLMAGLLYCSLVLNWRMSIHLLRLLRGQRTLPHRIHARQAVRIQWTIHNKSRFMPACNIVVEDTILRADDTATRLGRVTRVLRKTLQDTDTPWWSTLYQWIRFRRDRNLESSSRMLLHRIDGQHSRVGTWRVSFPARGRYQVGPASISTLFPLGLLRSKIRIPATEICFVAPALGKLSPVWEKRQRSLATGEESGSRQQGVDPENFYALRPWRTGDNRRSIHWRTTARVGQPIVKQFEEKHNRDFALVLDLWHSEEMGSVPDGSSGQPASDPSSIKAELALSFTATILSRVGKDLLGRVALGVCGSESVMFHSRYQSDWVSAALKCLATVQTSPRPQLASMLTRVSNIVSAGTPVYVVSNRQKPGQDVLQDDVVHHVTANPVSQDDAGAVSTVATEIRLRKSRRLLSDVRWLSVDSREFDQLFSKLPDSSASLMPEGGLADA